MEGETPPDIKSKGKKKKVKKVKKTKEEVDGEVVHLKKKLKKSLKDGVSKRMKKNET